MDSRTAELVFAYHEAQIVEREALDKCLEIGRQINEHFIFLIRENGATDLSNDLAWIERLGLEHQSFDLRQHLRQATITCYSKL